MNVNPSTTMGGREWFMLLTLSVLWGSSFLFFALLVAELPILTVVLGRVGLAALALNLLLFLRGTPMVRAMPWRAFAVMGLLNNVVPFLLFAFAVTRIPSGLAAILNATTPIFTVLAAHALTRDEKLGGSKMIGVASGFAGVVVLVGPGLLADLGQADVLGQASCLLAALSYAFAGLYGRRFRGLAPLHVATGQITASTALVLPFALIVDRFWALPMPSATVWGGAGGHRTVVHCGGLYPVFRDPCARRCHQPVAGDVLAPGQRPGAGCVGAGRAGHAARIGRHGVDGHGPCRHRWTHVAWAAERGQEGFFVVKKESKDFIR